jgi:fructose-1-phosphate kinase PfkB-like protein
LDASGAALREGLKARPWLVKPNRHEAEELLRLRLRSTAQAVRAARHLLARGPQLVILSLGAEGALLAGAAAPGPAVWLARAPVVRTETAVGAGDSLVGGFVTGWLRGLGLVEAFRLGVACGAACAMTPGTELCRRGDVRRVVRHVSVRRVA